MRLEDVLTQSQRVAEEAECFLVRSQQTPVGFEANRLKMLETKESSSVSLRIIKDGKIGLATTSGLDDPRALVAMAVETAQFGAEARFLFPQGQRYPQVDCFDPAVEQVAIEEMVEMGGALISRLLAHTPELLCDAGVTRGTVEVTMLNSRGGAASYRKSLFSVGVEGTLVRGTDMLFVGDMDSSCRPIQEIEHLAQAVTRQLELARDTASVRSGDLPAVFTHHGVRSAFFSSLALALNGKMVYQEASPLAGRQGERVLDEHLTVWDDATIAYRPASRPCDDEGMPSRRTPLVRNGVVTQFLYDLQTAALAGAQSTGNGSRAGGGVPTPSVAALTIDEGDTTFEAMVRDMREGLVIEQLIGAEQGNVLGGEFSGNVLLGYKVENGQIVGRVKDTMVSGNIYDVLKGLVAIGSEARWVGGSLRTPALYVPRLAVASKA